MANANHCFVYANGKLYGWGWNTFGQLGIPRDDPQDNRSPIEIPVFGEPSDIHQIQCGATHTLVLSAEILFGVGRGDYAETQGCGIYNILTQKPEFDHHEVLQVACGSNFSVLLTSAGVQVIGDNTFGQRGVKSEYQTRNIKLKVLPPIDFGGLKVVQVNCGSDHCFALTSEGFLFGWGRNNFGQLGAGHYKYNTAPQRISFFDSRKILQISCGAYHTLALTPKGLYSWGENSVGQLGLGWTLTRRASRPQKITFFRKKSILKVRCGGTHCLALTSEGLFSWGAGNNGQLGIGSFRDQDSPQKVEFFSADHHISEIDCGQRHSLTLTSQGLFTWGLNDCGQLGIGSTQDQCLPHLVLFFDGVAGLILPSLSSVKSKKFISGLWFRFRRSFFSEKILCL